MLKNHAKKSAKDAFKLASEINSKNTKSNWWFHWKKIADKITSKAKIQSHQHKQKNLPKKIQKYQRKDWQQIIHELRLMQIMEYDISKHYRSVRQQNQSTI